MKFDPKCNTIQWWKYNGKCRWPSTSNDRHFVSNYRDAMAVIWRRRNDIARAAWWRDIMIPLTKDQLCWPFTILWWLAWARCWSNNRVVGDSSSRHAHATNVTVKSSFIEKCQNHTDKNVDCLCVLTSFPSICPACKIQREPCVKRKCHCNCFKFNFLIETAIFLIHLVPLTHICVCELADH